MAEKMFFERLLKAVPHMTDEQFLLLTGALMNITLSDCKEPKPQES